MDDQGSVELVGERRNSFVRTSFLTASCDQRRAYFASEDVRTALAIHLGKFAQAHGVELHAWVIMSNHVHLVATTIRGSFSVWVRDWKRGSVHFLRRECMESLPSPARCGRFWLAGRGYDREIWSWQEYKRKVDYTELNPVRAGLVCDRGSYQWSSAMDQLRRGRGDFPQVFGPPSHLEDLRRFTCFG